MMKSGRSQEEVKPNVVANLAKEEKPDVKPNVLALPNYPISEGDMMSMDGWGWGGPKGAPINLKFMDPTNNYYNYASNMNCCFRYFRVYYFHFYRE